MKPFDRRYSVTEAIEQACLLEAHAPKLGNVHPNARFHDVCYADFVRSGRAIAPCFKTAQDLPVGQVVLAAVRAMRNACDSNTHLGTILLLAPIAKAATTDSELPCPTPLEGSLPRVLRALDAEDARLVYQAIREAKPGGLGQQSEGDVSASATPDCLVAAMEQVAEHDAVARQYVSGFADVLTLLVPWLKEELARSASPDEAICRIQLRWLAHEPDGLIVRKAGLGVATEVQDRANKLWTGVATPEQDYRGSITTQPGWRELDQFLRRDGNHLNPGTTADLITAALVVILAGLTEPGRG